MILKLLKRAYPGANCALSHKNPLQLMVSTILSAQCTDKRVNMVTPALFARYKTARDFARAKPPELEKLVRSTGFFRQKARWIKAAGAKLEQDFGGQVPRTMEALLTLPGVARKTANVVLGTAFGMAEGIVVDTHVKRIAKKLGLTRQTDPVKVEQDLVKVVPRKDWIWFSHALITHGRQVCKAGRPLCPKCPLISVCPSREV
ncbi:MAG: endonuclease III [Elusimicrobia bacterium RIFCSPLOWO2_01_FULL_60_11]|nr:MAG: endonuclease III [Elusimicrobia bacterium RIFCSPLOWO2_01_FULL_60_11]